MLADSLLQKVSFKPLELLILMEDWLWKYSDGVEDGHRMSYQWLEIGQLIPKKVGS